MIFVEAKQTCCRFFYSYWIITVQGKRDCHITPAVDLKVFKLFLLWWVKWNTEVKRQETFPRFTEQSFPSLSSRISTACFTVTVSNKLKEVNVSVFRQSYNSLLDSLAAHHCQLSCCNSTSRSSQGLHYEEELLMFFFWGLVWRPVTIQHLQLPGSKWI